MTGRQNQGPTRVLPRGAHIETNGPDSWGCYCLLGRDHTMDEREL